MNYKAGLLIFAYSLACFSGGAVIGHLLMRFPVLRDIVALMASLHVYINFIETYVSDWFDRLHE